jgi:hypothetical protein
MQFRSPHSFFYVDVKDFDGSTQRWAIEAASPRQFSDQGVEANTFRRGDPVEVRINPSRDQRFKRGRLLQIIRTTDGLSWGTRPGETVN